MYIKMPFCVLEIFKTAHIITLVRFFYSSPYQPLYPQLPSKWADSTTITGCTQATASPATAAATNSECKKTARSPSTGKANLCGRTQKTSVTTSRASIFKMMATLSCSKYLNHEKLLQELTSYLVPMTTRQFGLPIPLVRAMRSISLCRMMEMLSCTRVRMMRLRPFGRPVPTRFKHVRLAFSSTNKKE